MEPAGKPRYSKAMGGLSPFRPPAAVLHCFGFGRITSFRFGTRIKALSDDVVDAAFAAMGREVAFDRMFRETRAVLGRFDAGAVGDGRSFRGGFRVGGDEKQRDHRQTCRHRSHRFG